MYEAKKTFEDLEADISLEVNGVESIRRMARRLSGKSPSDNFQRQFCFSSPCFITTRKVKLKCQ